MVSIVKVVKIIEFPGAAARSPEDPGGALVLHLGLKDPEKMGFLVQALDRIEMISRD